MKKRGLAVLALAAALTLGTAGISAIAAEGWAQENGRWAYYGSNGYKLTDVWRKGADGLWRYVDSSGFMAIDAWVDDDDYYVGTDGIMLSNQWLKVENIDSDSGYDFYYFTSTGKAVKDKWEKIDDQWYHFDDSGVMETGWILDDMYYCDENGIMLTGWQKLDPPEDYDGNTSSSNAPYYIDDDGKYWYYFSSNGKKITPGEDSSVEINTKKINGTYYAMDNSGAVQFGWVCTNGDTSDDISDYCFVDSDGAVRTGWYSIEPPDELRNNYEHDVEWFYFDKKGVPTVGPKEEEATTDDFKRINGNTYLFNEYGTPAYGLRKVYSKDGSSYSAYYFGTWKQSSLLSGKFKLDSYDDDVQYYFASSGKGYTGVYDSCLYYMGRIQKADSSNKYEVFTIYSEDGDSYKNYVVNTSGRISKSATVKDSSGVKYKTNSSGILISEDGEEVTGNTYTAPQEPDWDLYD